MDRTLRTSFPGALALAALLVIGLPSAVAKEPPPASSPAAAPGSPLDALRFLVGTWNGASSGEPGEGTGTATFAYELDGRVLVRRSRTAFPAAQGKPGVVHEDLMVIHAEPGGRIGAEYFDSEGHVIRYAVEVAPDGRRAVFSSATGAPGPAFRLTYASVDADTVDVAFAIAPPGKPGEFTTHVAGRTCRAAKR